jgi:PleD family two-component response regulator
VTASIGLAHCRSDPTGVDELLAAADVARCGAKAAGRDRVLTAHTT